MIISSNPYHPLRLQRELLTHGWGSHGWLMERRRWWWWWRSPRNPCPGRVLERCFWFWIAVSDDAAQRKSIWEKRQTPDSFRSKGICRRKRGSRRRLGWSHHPWARLGLGRAPWWWACLPAPFRLVFWLRGSSGKIGILQYFPGFFLKVRFLQKNKTPGQFCWKQR
jgi:hypothetical protein